MNVKKIVLTLGLTYATVTPALVFKSGEPCVVPAELADDLLTRVDETGARRFEELSLEEDDVTLTGDDLTDAGLSVSTQPDDGTVDTASKPKVGKTMILGKKAHTADQASDTEGSVTV